MVREIISIDVGQCGLQMGSTIWKQYIAEHNIPVGTNEEKKNDSDDDSFLTFFQETDESTYTARSLMVDLEPMTINDVKTLSYSSIFNPDYLLSGKEDSANNYARGHYTVGKEIIDKVGDKIRKLVEDCDNHQGFIMNHAVGGGTGSGLGTLILERIAVDYRKKSKVSFSVYPSPLISTSTVEVYNAAWSQHYFHDHTEATIILDNEALYEICQNKLDIKNPDYDNINKLIAKCVSSTTCGLRFKGDLNMTLQDFQTNLVPFPRLHFLLTSMSPIVTPEKYNTLNTDTISLTNYVFEPSNFFLKVPSDFDIYEDLYMAISLQFRGNIPITETNDAVKWVGKNEKCKFVEWCPTGFKVGVNDNAPNIMDDDDIAYCDKHITMIGNNSSFGRLLHERICKKWDIMYSQRAFIHWFVGEGCESGEWAEVREDIGFLEKDYLDILAEQATDEDDEDDYYDDSDENI